MAKQRHRRHHPHECLTIEGEDRQEKDGIGMKVEGVELVMSEDGVEKFREGGTSPAKMLCTKKG